jgi:hypothetical protein
MTHRYFIALTWLMVVALICGCGGAAGVGRAVGGIGRAVKPAAAIKPAGAIKIAAPPLRPVAPGVPVARPVAAPHVPIFIDPHVPGKLSALGVKPAGVAAADDAARAKPVAQEGATVAPDAAVDVIQRGVDLIPGGKDNDDERRRKKR